MKNILKEAPRKGIPSNVPPESKYKTPGKQSLKQQIQQRDWLDDPELAKYTYQEPPKQTEGIYLRFETAGSNIVAYWSRSLISNYSDIKSLNASTQIITMLDLFQLLQKLEKQYHHVLVHIDAKNMRDNLAFFSKLHAYSQNNPSETIDWEFYSTPSVTTRPQDPSKVNLPNKPDSLTPLKITAALQAAFASFFKRNSTLSNKLAQVAPSKQNAVRQQIMQVLSDYEGEEQDATIEISAILNKSL
jgi:hypothetical protein